MKYLPICILSLILFACSSKHYPVASNITMVNKDKTVTERVVWRNAIIAIPVERVQQVVQDSSHLETSLAASDARILPNGSLFHSLSNKPGNIKDSVPVIEKEVIVYQDSIQTVVEVVKVEKNLTIWQRIMMALGYIGLGVIGFGCIKFFR